MNTSSRINLIDVIGLGMGAGLGRSEMERLAASDLLAGGARLLERFAHLPGERLVLSSPISSSLDALAKAVGEGKRVTVLAGGDPLFFGIGARLIERFGRESLRFSPGVTAVQTACARLGLPWNDLPAVSLHGRQDTAPLLSALARSGKAAVHTDNVNTPGEVARLLLEHAMDEAAVWVLEDLGGPGERVRRFTPAEAAREEFSPLNMMVIELPGQPDARPLLGRPDGFYDASGGLVTKWPVRAAAIAALRIEPETVLWDVGAGSGAVAIESSALAHAGRVFAVERDPARHARIKENIRTSGAWLVKALKAEAPEAFLGLPDPDRVFMGGSLGCGTGALSEACSRLKPGGRIVAATVLLGSLSRALGHFGKLGWETATTQVQAGVSSPLAGDVRLAALNPVFIISADKPA
ncbi:MAG: precorrin-6y C5,15-methyltransferase (decarboxylating) subunit CbiE [Thermodesulfobacteriota bacterium]